MYTRYKKGLYEDRWLSVTLFRFSFHDASLCVLLVPPSRSNLRSPHGITFDTKKIDENGAKGTRRIGVSRKRNGEIGGYGRRIGHL